MPWSQTSRVPSLMTEGSVKNAIETQRKEKRHPGSEINESGEALGRGNVRDDAQDNRN